VRCGYCIHLVTSHRFDALPAQQTPELQRTPLDHVVLRAKKLYAGRAVAAVLADLPEPPSPVAVKAASNVLVSLGALERVGGPPRGRAAAARRVDLPDAAERRIDITDGTPYTHEEFVAFYGGDEQCMRARRFTRTHRERRLCADAA
jgi:hypothetical protein